MDPKETGARYDRVASWYQQNIPETYGIAQLERAVRFARNTGFALDVGCGSNGRFLDVLLRLGFQPAGIDVSGEMMALARQRHPSLVFYHADICDWELPATYDLISAWDSTFHLPFAQQAPVLKKLCAGLNPGGVLLFTCGGGGAGEISGSFQGETFDYSTLGVEEFLRLLAQAGCSCLHVEYDQYPENHVYIIARKEILRAHSSVMGAF